jgi:hypothetical protein
MQDNSFSLLAPGNVNTVRYLLKAQQRQQNWVLAAGLYTNAGWPGTDPCYDEQEEQKARVQGDRKL